MGNGGPSNRAQRSYDVHGVGAGSEHVGTGVDDGADADGGDERQRASRVRHAILASLSMEQIQQGLTRAQVGVWTRWRS